MWKRKNPGIITVFVSLMMVPVVVITGIMVDVSRLKFTNSQAAMAADTYGDAILSEYDNLLKDLYGLFSVTQNEDGLKALEEFQEYVKIGFHPAEDGKSISGASVYRDTVVEVSYKKATDADLNNHNVLETQIADFMKYRIVQSLGENLGLLDVFSAFDNMESDMNAMEKRQELSNLSTEILDEIRDFWVIYERSSHYPDYLVQKQQDVEAFSNALTTEVRSDDYHNFVYLKEHESEAVAARSKLNRILSAQENGKETKETMTDHENYLVNLYENYHGYGSTIKNKYSGLQQTSKNQDMDPVDFAQMEKDIKELIKRGSSIETKIAEIQTAIEELKAELVNCTQDVREAMEKEIDVLEAIGQLKGNFQAVSDFLTANNASDKNEANKKAHNTVQGELEKAFADLQSGKIQPDQVTWPGSVTFNWRDPMTNATCSTLYDELHRIFQNEMNGESDKNAGKKKITAANNKTKQKMESLKEETTTAKDITPELAKQLKSSGAKGKPTKDFFSYFSGGLSFKAVGGAATEMLDYFYTILYDYDMFSSRVSGVNPEKSEAESTIDSADGEEAYKDYSLTGYELSQKINYLYGAELEYLIGGHNTSKDNLTEVRNIICGVRLTMNFASTYVIPELHNSIEGIATAAAALAGPAAPVVKLAVSGALRMAVATIETVGDWDELMERQKVVFFKRSLEDLSCFDEVAGFLGDVPEKSGTASDFTLGYEEYLLILMFFKTDNATLMKRTSNLICLNRNQAVNEGDTLTKLDWTMDKTMTAVETTVKTDLDFVVIPESFMNLFLSGSQTESTIQSINDVYYGYTIIRGY